MKPLKIAAQMQPSTRRADEAVTLKFITKEEIDTDLFALIDSFRRVNGWLLFAPDAVDDSEIPNEKAVEGERSPSQLLRGALWLLHQRRGNQTSWPVFYDRQMERIRQTVIDSLE